MKAASLLTVVAFLGALFPAHGAPAQASEPRAAPFCEILDYPSAPSFRSGLGVLGSSRIEGYGSTAMLEFDADAEYAYVRDVLCGDADIRLGFGSVFFLESTGLRLPNQLVRLNLDTVWTFQNGEGGGVQARFTPGIYSDTETLDTDMFYFPFSIALIQAFDRSLSAIAGAQIRVRFDREVIPILGVAWQIRDDLRLEGGIPQAKLTWRANQNWSTEIGLQWSNVTYSLHDGLNDPDQITLEDYRLWSGLTCRLSDRIELTGLLGMAFWREIDIKTVGAPGIGADADETLFLRLALSGPF